MRKSFHRHGLVSYVATLAIAVVAAALADATVVNVLGESSFRKITSLTLLGDSILAIGGVL
jgi:hypothetical protein